MKPESVSGRGKGSRKREKVQMIFALIFGFLKATSVNGFYRGEKGLGEDEVLFVEGVEAEDSVVGFGDAGGDEGGDGEVEVFELDEVEWRGEPVGVDVEGELGESCD